MFLGRTDRGIHKWHSYFPVYEKHFAQFKTRAISILEIGVQRGGSLRLWREYLGPRARIFGIDVDPECKVHEDDGIKIFIGDQTDTGFLQSVVAETGPLDVIIDDGGHLASQQISSFISLFPHLNYGGVYLVEDLHAGLYPERIDYAFGVSFLDLACALAPKLTYWHKDDKLYLERYDKPREDREGGVWVPEITQSVSCISFYDSIVAFEKERILEPRHEVR
jgi:hypothetical protein